MTDAGSRYARTQRFACRHSNVAVEHQRPVAYVEAVNIARSSATEQLLGDQRGFKTGR